MHSLPYPEPPPRSPRRSHSNTYSDRVPPLPWREPLPSENISAPSINPQISIPQNIDEITHFGLTENQLSLNPLEQTTFLYSQMHLISNYLSTICLERSELAPNPKSKSAVAELDKKIKFLQEQEEVILFQLQLLKKTLQTTDNSRKSISISAANTINDQYQQATKRFRSPHVLKLNYNVGDVITVIDRFPTGWWKGEIDGQVGYFKVSDTQPLSVVNIDEIDGTALQSMNAPPESVTSNEFQQKPVPPPSIPTPTNIPSNHPPPASNYQPAIPQHSTPFNQSKPPAPASLPKPVSIEQATQPPIPSRPLPKPVEKSEPVYSTPSSSLYSNYPASEPPKSNLYNTAPSGSNDNLFKKPLPAPPVSANTKPSSLYQTNTTSSLYTWSSPSTTNQTQTSETTESENQSREATQQQEQQQQQQQRPQKTTPSTQAPITRPTSVYTDLSIVTTVKFSFKGGKSSELPVSKGETVSILKDAGPWTLVQNSEGKKGYVPSNYLARD